MIDLGEYDARRTVLQSEEDREGVFRRFRERLEELTKTQFGSTIETEQPTRSEHGNSDPT